MVRPLRIEYPGAWYHVMNRGAQRRAIVEDDADRDCFQAVMAAMSERFRVEVHAWCLMDNHYHLMVRTPEGNLGRAMRHLNGVYTQHFNRWHGRDGALFRGRYKAVLVEAEAYWTHLSRYVHRNPLEAGVVAELPAYPWSSYPAYVGKVAQPEWLATNAVLERFGDRAAYRRFVEEAEGESEIATFYAGPGHPSILGSEEFRERVLADRPEDPEVAELRHLRRRPTVDQILEAVARYYGVSVTDLKRPVRGRGVRTPARGMAMYLCQEQAGWTLGQIAQLFRLSASGSAGAAIRNVRARVNAGNDRLCQDTNMILHDLTP